MSIFSEDSSAGDATLAYSQHLQPALAESSGNPFDGGDGFASSSSTRTVPASSDPLKAPPKTTSPQKSASSTSSKDTFHEVKTDTTKLTTGISYPATEEKEFDDSKVKHGKIAVGEPEMRGNKLINYHVYKVSCASGSVEHVFRRYSDFVWLRNVLVKSFPGIFIPPLPPKQVLGNKNENFVEGRRLDLQRWLTRIVIRPFLSEHPAVELFLFRATASFEKDQKDMEKATDQKPLSEIISLYQDLFPEIVRLGSSEETEVTIEALKDFLNATEKTFNTLTQATDKFCMVNDGAVTELAKVTAAFTANFDLEKAFVSKLPNPMSHLPILNRVDLTESFATWHRGEKWSANSYDELFLTPFIYEHQDIVAMIDVVKSRNELATRHAKSLAKVYKWSEPKNAPKNEKQESQKLVDEQTAKEEGILLNLVSKLIIHAQFEQFWTFRVEQFRKRLFRFARAQMEATKALHENWSQIAAATVAEK